MNEIAASLSMALLRMSLFLGAAALAVQLLLSFARPGSSRVHRVAWFLVLLQGWFWWRLPVTIPYYEPAVVKQVASTPITPAPVALPRSAPAPVPITVEENHSTAQHPAILHRDPAVFHRDPAISHREIAAIDPPQPVERQTVQSWTATVRQNWPVAILGGWAAGMLLLAGASIVSYLRFLRRLRETLPVEAVWVREWEDLLARHHVRTGVPLWVTADVGPLLCLVPGGYRLVVPAGLWQRLTPASRLSILRHELAHLQRRDLLKSILVRLLMLPHWFNPLAWLAVRRFDEAAEWACDEVAKGTDLEGCRAYAAALLQLDAACGPRPSYHAAASGRGLSLRVQRLLSPQVKEDSLMKKTTILGVALALALVCLVRWDLVAKEPTGAAVGAATNPPKPAAGKPLGSQPQEPETPSAAIDALRYMPNGCQGIFWANMAELHKANPAWLKKAIGPGFGVRAEDIDRITVGSPAWPTASDIGFQFLGSVPQTVATIVIAQRVTVLEAKGQIEKSLGPSPWCEETLHGVTLHVQQSKKPIAFFLPAKQTLVIGSAKLVREVLVRGTGVQLSGKLAATWARLDQSHAIGLLLAPPVAGDPVRNFLPDDLCNGIDPILFEADPLGGKDVCFRATVPCVDAGVAYQVRGLCATVCKAPGVSNPQWAKATKSLQLAVNDRCFVLQGTLPASILQDGPKSATPPAGFTVRDILPDDVCDGVKSVRVEADMLAGKDLHLRFSVPCVDAGVANEVRGLCALVVKLAAVDPQLAGATKSLKSFQFAVNDRCFSIEGRLPASTEPDSLKTAFRTYLPDDVCNGVESVRFESDMIPGKDIGLRFSVRCVGAGIAYQVRGLCAVAFKFYTEILQCFPEFAGIAKFFQLTVNDRSFVLQGKLPASIIQDYFKARTTYSQGPQSTAQPPQTNPHQEVLCELSQTYLKGFQQGLTDPANQEEAGRRLLAQARERAGEFPQDAKLNEAQRMWCELSEVGNQGFLEAARWQDLDPTAKADEQRWLRQLESPNESARMLAIHALTVMRSKKAVPGILKLAADRKEKDNADREFACRALGIIGDSSVVPDLVHLTYHYNRDTRFWAQISLVRLTGENFGRDVAAWRRWWEKRGGKPPIAKKQIAWATSPETIRLADPKEMEAADRKILDMAKRLSTADRMTGQPLPTQLPGQSNDVPVVQTEINDIQPNGSIRFTIKEDDKNLDLMAIKNYRFMSSDFCKFEKITDGKGRPVHFTTEHKGNCLYYDASLNEAVPWGQTIALETEGTTTTLIQPTGRPGEFKYHMTHSPNTPCSVRRVEIHRLPPGAELLEKSPADMAETRKDGRIELRVERTIPSGGVIEVSYRYRVAGTR